MFKKVLRKLHLVIGLAAGIVIFTVCVTGSIYAFEKEIRAFLHKDIYRCNEVLPARQPLSLLEASVRQGYPGEKIKNILLPAGERMNVRFSLKNQVTVFVNPYNAAIEGSFNTGGDIFGVALNIHRTLLLGEKGKIITGISALVFLFMVLSGIILWWPANKKFLKQKLKIQRSPARKFLYDLHSVAGFYASWVLLFSILSGLIFAFKWAEGAMYAVTGSKKTPRTEFHSTKPGSRDQYGLDSAFAHAQRTFTSAAEYLIILPAEENGVYRVVATRPENGFFKKQDIANYDRFSGAPVHLKYFEENSTGEKMRATNYNIHTGKVPGVAGQLLLLFAALTGASLPVTGFLMWYKARSLKKKA
jgi:uncharacterized iron-regulated membrane protein